MTLETARAARARALVEFEARFGGLLADDGVAAVARLLANVVRAR